MFMQMNKTLFIGAAIGSVIMYFLIKDKNKKCPPCEKNSSPAPAPSFPTVVVQPTPAPAPAPVPPPPPPPPPPAPVPPPSSDTYSKAFVGFSGWGHVK